MKLNPVIAADCPKHCLGILKPFEFLEEAPRDEVVVHGVHLPRQVIEELQKQGIPLGWYHAGELIDAVLACHHDGQLVDDPDGVHFRDKLHLSYHEKSVDNLPNYPHARVRLRLRNRWLQPIEDEYEKEKNLQNSGLCRD